MGTTASASAKLSTSNFKVGREEAAWSCEMVEPIYNTIERQDAIHDMHLYHCENLNYSTTLYVREKGTDLKKPRKYVHGPEALRGAMKGETSANDLHNTFKVISLYKAVAGQVLTTFHANYYPLSNAVKSHNVTLNCKGYCKY